MARNKEEEGQEEEMNEHAVTAGMATLVSAIMTPLFVTFAIGDYGELRVAFPSARIFLHYLETMNPQGTPILKT